VSLADLNVLIAAGTFCLGAVGTVFAFWRWVLGTLRASDAETSTRLALLQAQIDMVRAQLGEFKLDVATHYASDDRLQQMEAKFTASIEKLINRFDAFATDFHRVVGRMEQSDKDRAGNRA
jgi:hypothetical protein